MAALLQSVRELSLSTDGEAEAAVAVDLTRRLHEVAMAGRVADANGVGAAQARRMFSEENARAAVSERLSGPLKELGLLDPENPLRFRACSLLAAPGQRGCKRCCLEELYQRDPEWFVRVATTGKQLVDQVKSMQYGNHKRDHKRAHRRRHVSSSRADDSGFGAAGGGLESELGADSAQRRVEARAKTIDEWVGGLSSFSAARRRQDTFVETTLPDLLDAGACVHACARVLHVSYNKFYYKTKSCAALLRGAGREQAHMSVARAAQGEDVRDTLIPESPE